LAPTGGKRLGVLGALDTTLGGCRRVQVVETLLLLNTLSWASDAHGADTCDVSVGVRWKITQYGATVPLSVYSRGQSGFPPISLARHLIRSPEAFGLLAGPLGELCTRKPLLVAVWASSAPPSLLDENESEANLLTSALRAVVLGVQGC